jgi:hypothetical protein
MQIAGIASENFKEQNMKRNLIIAFSLVLVSSIAYLWYSSGDTPFSKDLTLCEAVPVSSPFFFELSSIPPDHPILHELEEAGIAKSWFMFLEKADSIIGHSDKIPNNLRNSSFILSFGFAGKNELFPVLITKVENPNRQNAVELFIRHLYPPGKFSYRERTYGKHTLCEIIPNETGSPLFYSISNELLLISSKSILVEQVLRQLSTPGILKNPFFLETALNADDQKLSLYINHEWLSGFIGTLFSSNVTEKQDEFGGTRRYQPALVAEKFRKFAGWSKLNFGFYNDRLILNGLSAADDSLNHFLAVFSGQQPLRSKAENALPQNTSFYCTFSLSHPDDFFQRLETFYTHSDQFYYREERMKRFDQGFRTNTRNVFRQWVKDEVIVAATTIPVNPENKTTFFILETGNRLSAEEQLRSLLNTYAVRTGKDPNQMISELRFENAPTFKVYRFPFPSFPGLWIGNPFTLAEAEFVTFYNDYMVFSNTEQGLNEYLRNMLLGATLSHDISYQKFIKNQPNRANIHVHVDVNKAFGFRNEIFSSSLRKQLEEKEELIRKFGKVNLQVWHDKNMFPGSVILAYQPEAEEARTTWQSSLGSNLATKPQLVTNHNDPLNREIIVRDIRNNLYLLNNTGRVCWSVSLPSPVLGDIHQIDYFQNGRLQYLFNTKENLYLLDRNGENVEHFPVRLQSPATNGVNVFDYDHTRNYRYFVAGEDKKIYAYDRSGKIIQGWKFGQTDHPVTTPVQYFRVAGKDYIVFKDKSRIYIQDRQGETRVSAAARFENSNNPLEICLGGTPAIVATSAEGKVFYIYFDGRYEEKQTRRFSAKHFFTAADLDGNGVNDFVYADGNELTVLDENGKRLFSKKLDNPVSFPPSVCTFSSTEKKTGITDAAANRIYLYNSEGKLHPGFPLQGNSEFTIGKLSENSSFFNLITGNEGGMLYNYTLN